jgi:cytochrome c2
MRALASTTVFAILALTLSACGDSPATPAPARRPPDPKVGLELAVRKCTLCHTVNGRGGVLAPPMEQSAVNAAKVVADYAARAKALQQSDPKTYKSHAKVIEAIAGEPDLARRYQAWIAAYLPDPRFDNPQSRMGAVVLSEQELADIVAWMSTLRPDH